MIRKNRILYIVGFAGLFLAFFWFFYRSKNLNSKVLRRVLRALQMAFIAALIWISTLLPTFAKTDDPSFGVHGLQPSPSRFWPRKSGQCGKPPSAGRPNPFRPKVNPYRTAPNLVDQGVGAAANPAGGGDAQFGDSCPVPKTGKKSDQFQNPNSLNQSKKTKKRKRKNSRAVSRTRVNEAYQDFISEMNKKGYKVNISEDRFAELSVNPQTREFDEQSISEAYGTLELELKNMIKNLRRTKNPKVDLDFMAERVGSGETIFLDHKEMIDFESLSDQGIDVSYFPSHEEVAFNMGKDSVQQKQTFLEKDQGPTSMEEIVHVFNFKNIRDRTEIPLLLQAVLNGAEEAGYTDGMIFLNYQ